MKKTAKNSKKLVEEKSIGLIKFGKFIPEKMYRVDFEADEKVMKTFAEYGLKKIKEDEAALINYAINVLLSDMVKNEKAKV